MHLDSLAVPVRQARESSILHSDREICPLDVRRANHLLVRAPDDGPLLH